MGQYERRFEERGVPAGRQTRGVPPEQQAREQELVEPEADNPARKVDKPRRLPSTRLVMADTRLVEINVACSPGAPRSSWQCPGSMPPLGLTCPDHHVRGLADFGLATGRERSSERPRGRVAVTHDLAGGPVHGQEPERCPPHDPPSGHAGLLGGAWAARPAALHVRPAGAGRDDVVPVRPA